MEERCFWELLGLRPGADRREVKRAYHRLARQNHPDFFPPARKPLQELKMISLNEAYAQLMSRGTPLEPPEPPESVGPRVHTAAAEAAEPAAPEAPGGAAPEPAAAAVGLHREPAYAYYKQGFIHYSRAVHGVEALYQSIKRRRRLHFSPRDDAYERFAAGLTELGRAHEYFERVVAEHPASVWAPDAGVKLARIERFSQLYRRILRNLRASGPAP